MRSIRFLVSVLSFSVGFPFLLLTEQVEADSYICNVNLGQAATSIIGGMCYGFFSETKSWTNAEASCVSKGGTLAVVSSSEVKDAIVSMCGSSDPWIGAGDDSSIVPGASEGNFFWLGDQIAFWMGGQAGSAISGVYSFWAPDEPNNLGNEDCVHSYHGSGNWNDLNCASLNTYVCQFPAQNTEANAAPAQHGGGGGLRGDSLQKHIEEGLQLRYGVSHAAAPLASVLPVAMKSSVASVHSSSSSLSSLKTSKASSSKAMQSPVAADVRIVAAPTVNLRTDSRMNATIKQTLVKGQTLTLLGIAYNDWAHVRLPNGKEGYVWRKYLTK